VKAGNQAMLWAGCKGKAWAKKLSKKWMGPHTIIEVHSPQMLVLKEPNSRNWFTSNINLFNTANQTTSNSSLNNGHYKVKDVLGRHDYKIKWVCYTNHHKSWVPEEDLQANHLLEQFQASESSATMDRLQSTKDSAHAGRGCESQGDELPSMVNKYEFTFSIPSLWVVLSHFHFFLLMIPYIDWCEDHKQETKQNVPTWILF